MSNDVFMIFISYYYYNYYYLLLTIEFLVVTFDVDTGHIHLSGSLITFGI